MSRETHFIIFCMENYKRHRALTGKQVAELFENYDVYGYIHNFFDVLHGMGYQFVNQDIDGYLKARHASIPEGV